jgi:hypothetical protein
MAYDRAAVVVRAIMRIFADHRDPDEQRRQIEQLLRDEFYDERRIGISERCIGD